MASIPSHSSYRGIAEAFQITSDPSALSGKTASFCSRWKSVIIAATLVGIVSLTALAIGCASLYGHLPINQVHSITLITLGAIVLSCPCSLGIIALLHVRALKKKKRDMPEPLPSSLERQPLPRQDIALSLSQDEPLFSKNALKNLLEYFTDKRVGRNNAFTLQIGGETYCVWYVPKRQLINIQQETDWTSSNKNKLSLHVDDDGNIVTIYADGVRVSHLSAIRVAWMNAVLEAYDKQLSLKQPQQFSESLLRTLKLCLQLLHPKEHILKNRIMVWYDPNLNSINIQDLENYDIAHSSQDNKLAINFDNTGKITSLWVNGVQQTKQAKIPEAFVQRLNMCCKEMLRICSFYKNDWGSNGGVLSVKMLRQGLKEVPLFHLKRFCEQVQEHVQVGTLQPQLAVGFLTENLNNAMGMDAGGLSRDYMDDLCTAITQSSHLKFHTIDTTALVIPQTQCDYENGQALPKLSEKEASVYSNLGILFMFCYHSEIQHQHWDHTCTTGLYFSEALFKAALCLTAYEIKNTFTSLSMKTKVKMCKALATAHDDRMFDRWIELLEKNSLLKEELQEAAQIAYDASFLPEDLATDQGPDEVQVEQHPERVKQALQDTLFGWKGTYGQFGAQLEPIHKIAEGMLSVCCPQNQALEALNMHSTIRTWQHHFLDRDFQEFSKKVQGSIDREEIVESFALNPDLSVDEVNVIHKKVEWLKEWIQYEASDEEVRKILKFVVGSSCLPKGKKISVIKQLPPDIIPVPKSHTCSVQIELAPVPTGVSDGYNDFTKEAFIKCLKECALTDPGAYSSR